MTQTLEKPPSKGWAAVYRLFGSGGELLYIGSTGDPAGRWSRHKFDKPWWDRVVHWTFEWHASREEAFEAERRAIRAEGPRINVHWIERSTVDPARREEAQRVFDALAELEAMTDPLARAQAISQVLADQAERGPRLRELRRAVVLELREQKVSYRKIAAQLGVSLGTVQDIERGHSGNWGTRVRKKSEATPPAE